MAGSPLSAPAPGRAVAPDTSALLKWAEIDATAIRDNTAAIRRVAGVAVMAMVKADGYGHGATVAARAALAGGASWLGVSSAEEALRLRAEGVTAPILVAGWGHPARLAALIAAGVDLTVWTPAQVAAAAAAAGSAPARVHLKVDTGMGRLGCAPGDLDALAEAVARAGDPVRPIGVFTHFAVAEDDPAWTREQDRVFRGVALPLRRRWPELILHAANSAAALLLPETRHDLVRCGISIYGYPPPGAPLAGWRPAMRVAARITQVKTVAPGHSVGYGRTWVAERPTRVATVAAGYADGIHRALSNRGAVLIGGSRCPVVGRISMDQLTADVSRAEPVGEGEEAVLIGGQGDQHLGADEVAAWAGTISYELLCAVSARVPRVTVQADAGRP
jgi:alanine racemase